MLLSDYQERWKDDFNEIKDILLAEINGFGIEIEHIGSTAIKGMIAKPIIDIDLVYHDKEDFDKIKSKLEGLNYYHNGDQGISGREVFKRNSTSNDSVLDTIQHHLYVCHEENVALKRHLLFRDVLSQNPTLRKQYKQLKIDLTNRAIQDKKKYAQLKESEAKSFFDSILKNIKK